METVRYSQGRLLGAAAAGGAMAAFFAWSLVNPAAIGRGFFIGRMVASPLGQLFLVPLIIVAGILLLWRASAVAMGDLKAIEVSDGRLKVNTLWRRLSFDWRDVHSIEVERIRVRFASSRTLVFRTATTKARLHLGFTGLSNAGVGRLLTALEMAQAEGRRSAAVPSLRKGPAPAAAEGDGGFDADAAIARYLARKAAEGEPVGAAAGAGGPTEAPRVPARPAFGRKGVHG